MTTTTTADAPRRPWPRAFRPHGAAPVELRLMGAGDEAAVLAFAARLPAHDLLFLPRDISQPKVVAAWAQETGRGGMATVLAARGEVIGCATLASDPLSWSRHVGELRLLVAPEARGRGLGQRLAQEAFELALERGLEKLTAQMTTDQRGAIAVFQSLGFQPEALLHGHVKDRAGRAHDVVTLGCDVARFQARLEAYGVTGDAG